jgi:hypothetical protein
MSTSLKTLRRSLHTGRIVPISRGLDLYLSVQAGNAEHLADCYDPDHDEGDDLDDQDDEYDLDEGDLEQDEAVPEPGFRRTVDGHRGARLQGDDGRPGRPRRKGEDELGAFDQAELEEQRRQAADEEDQRQQLRQRNAESLDAYARRRAPWLYGRAEPYQAYARRGRRRL